MSKIEVLKMLLENAGVGWVFRGDEQESLRGLLDDVRATEMQYQERYQAQVDLLAQCKQQFEGMRPFVRSLATPMSQEFRLLVLRLLTGAEIEAIQYEYEIQSKSMLVVRLVGEAKPFLSKDVWDFDILRHLGTMKISGRPVLHGYFDFAAK